VGELLKMRPNPLPATATLADSLLSSTGVPLLASLGHFACVLAFLQRINRHQFALSKQHIGLADGRKLQAPQWAFLQCHLASAGSLANSAWATFSHRAQNRFG
jgi:hypothetical protein